VYADQQIHELIEKVETLKETTSPKNISKIASDIADEAAGQKTPRYRGKTSTPDLQNTGIIDGEKMNANDRILYIGTTQGVWIPNRVYRWLGSGWEMLDPPTEDNRQNANHYLEANGDVTEGAPDAVFSFAQIRSIVTSGIFSRFMGAVDIELIEMEINGKKRVGEIRSSNFVSQADATPQKPAAGFRIRYNGDCEFNNGNFRGHIEADSGSFSGELKGATGTFRGDLTAGTLKATEIEINAQVTPGTNYVIRRENHEVSWNQSGSGFDAIKEIVTPARGNAILVATFSSPGNGQYRIRVNSTILVDWTSVTKPLPTDDISWNINLSLDVNEIYLDLRVSPGSLSGAIVNRKFELRTNTIPKALRFLG
jgi:hypothetical protein